MSHGLSAKTTLVHDTPPLTRAYVFHSLAGWLSELDLYRRGTSMPASLKGQGTADELLWQGAVEVVQEEGDLIVIPPRWWHQVKLCVE